MPNCCSHGSLASQPRVLGRLRLAVTASIIIPPVRLLVMDWLVSASSLQAAPA
jgi:hypothetical protein